MVSSKVNTTGPSPPSSIVFAVTTALVIQLVLVPAAPGAPWFATEP
ncbi:hypothetical protein BQ8420_27760 [Nocardiopsis sp. JB363]|nr:hypothetical protein BQ8420_27760 [Nocardiopsis sp. JB363]